MLARINWKNISSSKRREMMKKVPSEKISKGIAAAQGEEMKMGKKTENECGGDVSGGG
jgi:hypothetical protein